VEWPEDEDDAFAKPCQYGATLKGAIELEDTGINHYPMGHSKLIHVQLIQGWQRKPGRTRIVIELA